MFGCPGAKAVEKVAFGIEVADGVAKDGALAHHVATQGGKGKQADAQEGCHKHNAQVALALGGKDNLRRKEGEKGAMTPDQFISELLLEIAEKRR